MRGKYISQNGIEIIAFRLGFDGYPEWFDELIQKGIVKLYFKDNKHHIVYFDEEHIVNAPYIVKIEGSKAIRNMFIIDESLFKQLFERIYK